MVRIAGVVRTSLKDLGTRLLNYHILKYSLRAQPEQAA